MFFADFGDREHVFMPVRDHRTLTAEISSDI